MELRGLSDELDPGTVLSPLPFVRSTCCRRVETLTLDPMEVKSQLGELVEYLIARF